jgi:photosystem II stability/assembly factor-like uncharacterized protein
MFKDILLMLIAIRSEGFISSNFTFLSTTNKRGNNMKGITFFLLLISICTLHSQTWSPQISGTTAKLWQVQFVDMDNGYVCGDSGIVLKTTNGGIDWESANVSTTYPVRGIYFVNADEGWVAVGDENVSTTSGQIWHTTNGGNTWTQQVPSTNEARFGISFADSTVGWAVGSRNGPINIDATTNGGTSWTNQSNNNIYGWLYKVDALSTTTAFSIGVAYYPQTTGFIIRTTDGGSMWAQLNTGTVPLLNGIEIVDSANGFVVGDDGFIMATTDGGTSWTAQTSGTTDTLQDVSFVYPNYGWVCGFSGTIRSTVNGGTLWTGETSGTTQNLNGICAFDTNAVWAVGDGGTILHRDNIATGVHHLSGNVPQGFALLQNYPNPFNPSTVNSWQSPVGSWQTLKVYDALGREVATLVNEYKPAGKYKVEFNGSNLPSGVYLYKLTAGNFTAVKKLMLLK